MPWTTVVTNQVSGVWGICILLTLLAGSAPAASITKANNSTALNLAGSWVSGGPPGSADTVVVDNTLTNSVTANLGASMSWAGIQVVNPGGTLTIGATTGAALRLGSGGIDMAAAGGQGLTVDCLLVLGGANTWNVAASSSLTVNGGITNNGNPLYVQGEGNTLITGPNWGAGGLVKRDGGTLTLDRAPSYTGNVIIYGGTVNAIGGTGFDGVFGQAAAIRIQPGGTLYNSSGDNGAFGNPGSVLLQDVIVQAGGLLTLGSGVTAHIPRVLVLTGGEVGSTGTVHATCGSWSLERGVIVNGGPNTSVISAQGVTVNQTGGTVFNVGSGAASGIDLDVTGYIGHFPGTADNGVIKAGPGVMRLSGVNTYTSATTISNGVLALGSSGSISTSPEIFVSDGATFDVSSVSGNFTLGSGQGLRGSGVVTGSVTVAGGTLDPGAALSFSNHLTLAGSTTNYFTLSSVPGAATNDQIVVAGNLNLSGVNTLVVSNTTLEIGRYRLITYGGALSGGKANLRLQLPAGQQAYLDASIPNEIDLVMGSAEDTTNHG
ncbi:MAG TPA: autotransporter-associated beta strand repeat-containing protein [Verrucomicrobiota bacterium]|nr:autotransporter-associated beta strand repeat-containing protein [Verrucomicrobiota bacterium]